MNHPTPPVSPPLPFKKRKFEMGPTLRIPTFRTQPILEFLTNGRLVGTFPFANSIYAARFLQATRTVRSPVEFLDFLFTIATLLLPDGFATKEQRSIFCLRFFVWYVSEENISQQYVLDPLLHPLREFFSQRMKFKWMDVMKIYLEKKIREQNLVCKGEKIFVDNIFVDFVKESFSFEKLMQLFVVESRRGGLEVLLPNEWCWEFVKYFFFTLQE